MDTPVFSDLAKINDMPSLDAAAKKSIFDKLIATSTYDINSPLILILMLMLNRDPLH